MSASPPQQPGRIERAYNIVVKALTRLLVDIILPVTAVIIIYFILFGKVKDVAVALMLGGLVSAFLGIPLWTRQDRARRDGGGFTISIGRAPRDRDGDPPDRDPEDRRG